MLRSLIVPTRGAWISNSLSSGSRASWRSQPREVNDGDGPSSLYVARRNTEIRECPEGDGQLLVGCNQTSGDNKKFLEVMKVVFCLKFYFTSQTKRALMPNIMMAIE